MGDVEVCRAGAVAVLTLDRAEHRNSIGGELFADLLAAAEEADANEDCGALVTTGAGSTYCVGADLAELDELASSEAIDLGRIGVDGIGGRKGLPPQTVAQRQSDHLGIGRWTLRFRDLGIPTVAAVNGPAAGGGLALALLHDVRIASTRSKFAAGFITVGVGPEMGLSWLLTRIVGEARAFDILTRTQSIGADEALDLGLVEAVVEPEDLSRVALARAAALAALPSGAVRATKRVLHAAADASLHDQLEREWMAQRLLFASEDTRQRLGRSARPRLATEGPR